MSNKKYKNTRELLELDNKELLAYRKALSKNALELKATIRAFGEAWGLLKEELECRELEMQYVLIELEDYRKQADTDGEWAHLVLH